MPVNPKKQLALAAVASVAKNAGKKDKKKKKKKTAFSKFLSGAASVAAELAPLAIPMLLAGNGHAGSIASCKAATAAGQPAPMVGTAMAANLQPLTGLTKFAPTMSEGKMTGVVLCGMEYIGAIAKPPGGGDWSLGQVLFEIPLNPLDNVWNGTRLSIQAHLWERFRMRKIAVMYQPASASTTQGQMIAYIDSDPTEPLSATGREAVQVASSHAGAEMNQPWQMGCAHYVSDARTQDLYLDVQGTDERLVSAGNYRALAATDIDMTNLDTLGDIFVAYEIEMKVPDRSNTNALGGGYGYWSNIDAQTSAVGTPMSCIDGDNTNKYGSLAARIKYGQTPNGSDGLYNLPIGWYVVSYQWNVNDASGPNYTTINTGTCTLYRPDGDAGATGNGFHGTYTGNLNFGVLNTFIVHNTEQRGYLVLKYYNDGITQTCNAGNAQVWMSVIDGSALIPSGFNKSLQAIEKDMEKHIIEANKMRNDVATLKQQVVTLTQTLATTTAGGETTVASPQCAAAEPTFCTCSSPTTGVFCPDCGTRRP